MHDIKQNMEKEQVESLYEVFSRGSREYRPRGRLQGTLSEHLKHKYVDY